VRYGAGLKLIISCQNNEERLTHPTFSFFVLLCVFVVKNRGDRDLSSIIPGEGYLYF
jgi:hypothetical protein